MKSRINLFIYKTLLFTLPVLVICEVLFRLDYFPVITASTLFDTKMMHVQKLHLKNIKLLAVGSSITLYDLKSDIITRNFHMPYYNFSSWMLSIADTRELLKAFVKEYNPQYVIICSSLGDFKRPLDSSYLNYTSINTTVKNNFPEFFYLKNYNSVYRIMHRKYFDTPTKFDNWGGVSLPAKKKDVNFKLWDGPDIFPTAYTQENYNELDSLGLFLKQKSIKFIFIQAPIKLSRNDTHELSIKTHFDKCRAAVEKNGGVYLNYYNTTIFADSLFADRYHMLDPGSVILTKEIVTDLKKVIK